VAEHEAADTRRAGGGGGVQGRGMPATEGAGLARKVARLVPLGVVKG
jgi:hypothetical protein